MADQNFEGFFIGSGSTFLGVAAPKVSSTFIDTGNLGNANGGGNTNFANKQRRVPLAKSFDTYTHLSLPRYGRTLPASAGTGDTLNRAKNFNQGPSEWSLDLSDIGTITTSYAIYYSDVTDALYVLGSDISTKVEVLKVTLSTGAVSQIVFPTVPVLNVQIKADFHFEPSDPLNPDTTEWFIVSPASAAIGGGGTVTRIGVAKVTGGATTLTQVPLRVDPGDENLIVTIPCMYMTLARDLIVGAWSSGFDGTGLRYVQFAMQRGSARAWISIPYDGSLPLVERSYPDLKDIYPSTPPGPLEAGTACAIDIWEDSVVFHGTQYDGAAQTHQWIQGRRLFDRTDWDRFLHQIADTMNLPDREPFFT